MHTARIPTDVIARLHSAFIKTFSTDDMQTLWESCGLEFAQCTRESFSARLHGDYETYGKLISTRPRDPAMPDVPTISDGGVAGWDVVGCYRTSHDRSHRNFHK